MSMIKNFEAELKAFVIKVLEDLDLYHPPISTTPTPNTGGGQQPPGSSGHFHDAMSSTTTLYGKYNDSAPNFSGGFPKIEGVSSKK